MQINYWGESFFGFDIKNVSNEKVTVIVNSPYEKDSKLKSPKIDSDILLLTDSQTKISDIQKKNSQLFLINQAGEYEKKGVFIKGIAFLDQGEKFFNIIYKIEAEKVKVCYLPNFSPKKLSPEQLEEIGQIDVLIVPAGEESSFGSKETADIISQIEPRIVIPMVYGNIEKFLKVMGAEKIEAQKKVKIDQKSLPKEETEIIILEP